MFPARLAKDGLHEPCSAWAIFMCVGVWVSLKGGYVGDYIEEYLGLFKAILGV